MADAKGSETSQLDEQAAAAAKKKADAEKAAAEQAAANKAREDAASGATKFTHKVAKGLSIVCLRGHLDEDTPVGVADFGGKQADVEDLVRRGALVRLG